MQISLKDNVAVVVGAAEGIGLAIVNEFAAAGANVALVDRQGKVNLLADQMETAHGVSALAIVGDVTGEAAMSQAAVRVFARWGRCDHVVYAAAIGSGKFGQPFWRLAPSDWHAVLSVNLQGAVHVAHAFAPQMAEAGRGSLLFIASVAGQFGSPTDPPYSASKAGLINFAQCAARDLAPFNVRVNSLCPGMVATTLNRSVWEAWCATQPEGKRTPYDEWVEEKTRRVVPLGRMQQPDDMAAMVLFLASDRGANITGQTINVDGGYVMK